MANLNDDRSWAATTVRLLIYVVIAVAVAYAIAHYWSPHFDLRKH